MHLEKCNRAEWLEEQLRCQLDDEIDVPCLWQDLLRTSVGRISWLEASIVSVNATATSGSRNGIVSSIAKKQSFDSILNGYL